MHSTVVKFLSTNEDGFRYRRSGVRCAYRKAEVEYSLKLYSPLSVVEHLFSPEYLGAERPKSVGWSCQLVGATIRRRSQWTVNKEVLI